MLLILPPSETKRDGGDTGTSLDLAALSFPGLTAARRATLAGLRRLSRNLAASAAALHLGATQAREAARNRVVTSSPTMAAIDRYDGVLFDALAARELSPEARRFAGEHVAIASALFGLVGALDPIPAYRLSHDTRLPGVRLATVWREPVARALATRAGLVLDLRSEAYVKLAPLPSRPDTVFVRVVAEDGGGRRRPLNHFNKAGKGAFVRSVLEAGVVHPDVASLLSWAAATGIRLDRGAPGELDLVVEGGP